MEHLSGLRRKLAAHTRKVGVRTMAAAIGISKESLIRFLGDQPVRAGTLVMIKAWKVEK